MKRALIVVDMLKGFCREGFPLYCGKQAEEIVPFIQRKIREYDRREEMVIFLADNHRPDDKEFEMFPPHCVKGSEQAEVLPELLDLAENKIVLPKTRFDPFIGTNLDGILKELAPGELEIVGVCTNICVLYTVESLRARDYKTRVFRDGVASFDEKAHEFALGQMKDVLGAEVV